MLKFETRWLLNPDLNWQNKLTTSFCWPYWIFFYSESYLISPVFISTFNKKFHFHKIAWLVMWILLIYTQLNKRPFYLLAFSTLLYALNTQDFLKSKDYNKTRLFKSLLPRHFVSINNQNKIFLNPLTLSKRNFH